MENTEDPAIQLPSFGTFRINQQYIDLEIGRVIVKLRKQPNNSELNNRLRELWRLHQIIQPYSLRKKIPNNVRRIQTRNGDS